MNNLPPLLSICIPTYNRAYTLNVLLKSIEDEIIKYNFNFLEIIISDNASTDNTTEIVDEYIQRGLPIKYFTMEVNKGFGVNINNAVAIASGKYCWLMGSDDLVLPGALTKFSELVNTKADIIIGDSLTNNSHRKFLYVESGEYSIPSDITVCEYIEKCTEISSFFAFISVLIIKKTFWNAVDLDSETIEHPYTHQIRIIRAINDCEKEVIINYLGEPIVATGREINEWNESIYNHLKLDCTTLKFINDVVYNSDKNINLSLSILVNRQYTRFKISIARAFSTNIGWDETVNDLLYFNVNPSDLKKRKIDAIIKLTYTYAKKIRDFF